MKEEIEEKNIDTPVESGVMRRASTLSLKTLASDGYIFDCIAGTARIWRSSHPLATPLPN